MNKNFRRYIIFWLSQSISQLGSSMTGFALILWIFGLNGSAMTVSLLTFFWYVPNIILSLFSGAVVDRFSKKKLMLITDSISAVCSVAVLALNATGGLEVWHIYLVNFVIGAMNAFQAPASSVATGQLVPKERIAQVSGMNSFASNLNTVVSPVLAAALFAFGGLRLILAVDLASFVFAFFVLAVLIKIPESRAYDGKRQSIFSGCAEGFRFLRQNEGIFMIIATLAALNFFSALTYENILSPMILSRSGGSSAALGIVNAATGIGGILGGIIVAGGRFSKDNIKMIYVSAGLSFLLGDILMGLGRNTLIWAVAGLAACLPIPFINAGQNVILYKNVPENMQGRVFAVRNSLQFFTIPVGILLGGFLADYVFEPFMQAESGAAEIFRRIVGGGAGSGMALMFLCTGTLGSIFSFTLYHQKDIQKFRQ